MAGQVALAPRLRRPAILSIGPESGAHDAEYCGPQEEAEARRLAEAWFHWRYLFPDLGEDSWAHRVLTLGLDPIVEQDPRIDGYFEHVDAQAIHDRHKREQQQLAAVAREHYRALLAGKGALTMWQSLVGDELALDADGSPRQVEYVNWPLIRTSEK